MNKTMSARTVLQTQRLLVVGLLALPLVPATIAAQTEAPEVVMEDEAVIPMDDPIALLQAAIDAGTETLAFDSAHGYLPALLERLGIPVSSQSLVFSRTSLQTDRIAPWTPRALYFNDDVYIGFVQESAFLEIGAVDPDEGGVFYTLDQIGDEPPHFRKESTTCLMCHESKTVTGGVPGFMVLSVLPDRHGYVIAEVADGPQSDRTPPEKRMGGWYVTGLSEDVAHAGNVAASVLTHDVSDQDRFLADFDFEAAVVHDLSKRFDVSQYLTDQSDAAAIQVLTHQTRVHNLIAMAQLGTADALKEQAATLRIKGDTLPSDGFLPVTRVRIESLADRLAEGLLFAGEAPFVGPVEGTSQFKEDFEAMGPRDSRGRSLRDLDLQDRLFRYPASFLIYSDAFTALPEVMKELVFNRLSDVLGGEVEDDRYAHIGADERTTLLEILNETVPGFSEMTGER